MGDVSAGVSAMWRLIGSLEKERAERGRQLQLKNSSVKTPRPPTRHKRAAKLKSCGDLSFKGFDSNNNHYAAVDWSSSDEVVPKLDDDKEGAESNSEMSSKGDAEPASSREGRETGRSRSQPTFSSSAPRDEVEFAGVLVSSAQGEITNLPVVPQVVAGSFGEIASVAHQGWLTDQLRGRKVWGAISGQILCIYETNNTSVPLWVIQLMDCKVRPIEFNLGHESDSVNRLAGHDVPRAADRIKKHQFLIENMRNRQKQMFGVGSKPELDLWISTLNQASILDDHSKLSEDTGVCLDSSGTVGYQDSSGATTESEPFKLLASSDGLVVSRLPSPLLPKKRDARSLSFSVKQHSDTPADSVGDFRKFLRRDHHDDPHKPHPLKPRYEPVQQPAPATVKDEEGTRKSRSFLRTPLDFILRRKKRSSSADDAKMRRQNVSSRSRNQRGSESSASSSDDYGKGASAISDSFDRTSLPESPELPSRSLDRKQSQSLSLSLRRTATDFRDKILGSPKSREAKELKLRDLGKLKLSGFLQCRLNYKFTKVFCAVCRGWLYLFKTNRPECAPCVSVMLSQCSVTYVSEMEDRKKSLFAFKLSQTGCPSVYLLADDQLTLAKWMMSLQAEGSKVQMDTDLAAEVHEKRLTQKARQARELGMSPDDRGLARQVELQLKRNSCPVFSNVELHFLEGRADRDETGEMGDKSVNTEATEKGNNSTQSRLHDKFTGLPADIYEEEYSDMPCSINDEPPMSKSDANSCSTIDNCKIQQPHYILQPPQPRPNGSCDVVSMPVQTHELPTPKGPTQSSAISHEVNPTAKPRRVRTSKFSMDVKNESEKFLQSAMAAVRRTASLDKAVIQRPARFMPALSRPLSLYRSSSPQPGLSEDRDRVTSFFSPASCSPDEDKDAVDFVGSASIVRSTFGDNDSWDPLPSTNDSHVECESYIIPSQIHEFALKETWSKDEDFLMGVIKDQLRLRSQGETGANDVPGSDETVLIVNEEWGAGTEKQLSAPPKKAMESRETSDSSDPEAVTSFRKNPSIDQHNNATSGNMSASSTGSVTASSTGSFTSGVLNSGIDSGKMQGFVEKRGFDDKWTRFWCVLREACLYFYLRADDRASTDVTDLSGYEATQLIDSFPGRRFILRLDHKDYITVIVSLDTRDDLTSWHQAVKAAVVSLKKTSFSSQSSEDVTRPSTDDAGHPSPSPSAQTVKEKLLAEMLRQKEELEKIQAARLSLRNQDSDFQLSQTRGSSPTATADQICALTRLKQRRMSTQIKLDAIKKHIGDNTAASKEKKTVFQIGRKKPDLVPLEVQGKKNDLEEQVKSLSSRLEALDTCITSHGATSPREADSTDKSILKKGYSRYASDLNISRAAQLANESKKEIFYGSNGDISARLKDKDMSRSTSLKSSVQKLAHRTFGRANWHWSRKSTSPTEDKEDTKVNAPVSSPSYLSEVTPDVIDMTNNNSQVNGKLSLMVDGQDIRAPPDGFKTDYTFLSSTLPKNRGIVSMTTHKSYTMSTSTLSSSSTHLDRLSKRLIPSSSFPSLVESNVSGIGKVQGHHFVTAQKTNGQLPMSSAALDSMDSSSTTLDKGRQASLRREVTPSTLAQIEAFEELSNKFLKDSSK